MKGFASRNMNLFKMTNKCFSQRLVKIPYEDLIKNRNNQTLLKEIEKAYGQDGLGIIVIEKVPNFLEAKKKFFELIYKLMNLPAPVLKTLERPDLDYSLGYGFGKEYFNDKPDLLKASYYAQLLKASCNNPQDNNIWPKEIPELRQAFFDCGNIIRDNGMILLEVIDSYIRTVYPKYNLNYRKLVEDSTQNTGRMLYYYPRKLGQGQNVAENNWCEWHNDHGSLTGLASAIYIDETGKEANVKMTKTGLYIQDRKGQVIRVTHGKDDIAYQVGETLQIHSGGIVHATPHAVKVYDDIPDNVARITFPLFMQPNMDVKMTIPEGSKAEDIKTSDIYTVPKIEKRFRENMTFEEFNKASYDAYYKKSFQLI